MSRTERTPTFDEAGRNRVAIEIVCPQVNGGRFPIKRVAGDVVQVEADVFTDGHDALAAEIQFRRAGTSDWQRAPMAAHINDVWKGEFEVTEVGDYQYQIAAWVDQF